MSAVKVSDIASVRDLLEHPSCVELVTDALASAPLSQSAEEFVSDLPLRLRLGGGVARKLGEEMGLQSHTEDAVTLSGSYGHVLLGLLCGMAEQGIPLAGVEEKHEAEDCLLFGTVPSSPLSGAGELSARVVGDQAKYRIEASVTFKGQKFAWGRGKRILKRLFEDVETHVRDLKAKDL